MSELSDQINQITELRYNMYLVMAENMQPAEPHALGDPVARVLKAHLMTEAALDRLIEIVFAPNGGAVLSAKLSYAKKLSIISRSVLADGYGVVPDFVVGSLRKLNRLRNRLAHELGANITLDEARGLYMDTDDLLMIDPSTEKDISRLIYHYTPFVLGNMLPKDFSDEEE